MKNYDKSIEYAEKDLAANYQDLNLYLTLMRAYAGSTKVSDTIFMVINEVPDQAKNGNRLSRAAGESHRGGMGQDSERCQELAKDSHDYAVWAFFQLLPRVTDPAKQIDVLDAFLKTYPEQEKDAATQVNTVYFHAYRAQGNLEKMLEYGDKVVATDPNNARMLNTMA